MAKFMRLSKSMCIEPLLDFNRVTARQPTQKLILVNYNLVFRNSSYIASKKQRKNSAWVIGEAMRGAKIAAQNPNKSFIVTNDAANKAHHASSHVMSFLIPYLQFLVIGSLSFSGYAVVLVAIVIAAADYISKLLQILKYGKWAKYLFKDELEVINTISQKTSAAPNHKWTLSGEDLFGTLDAHTFENFIFSMCVLQLWWVLSRLISFVRRFHSKDVRK